ncbi:testis-expressed protein 36 isoform X1 [Columba livia]|uniref:testis-expressed protein 36 isoform X1 n=1 Tax=Columba livia TaxID=8932 RepID=UPI0031BAFD1F
MRMNRLETFLASKASDTVTVTSLLQLSPKFPMVTITICCPDPQPRQGCQLNSVDADKSVRKGKISLRCRQFAHVEVCQSQPESITSSAQKQVQDLGEAQRIEESLPLAYKTREQKAVNNNFPFSSHDNRHCLQNVGEYFDSGMGRKKPPPERRQQNSHNFFLWAHESVPSREDGLTVYQTSFVRGQSIEQPFGRRYPKHHSEKWCTGKPVPGNEENLQPKKSS